MAGLGDLPDLALIQIFSSLELPELVTNVALINKRFYQIVHQNSTLWRHFSTDHQLELSIKDLRRILKHSSAFLEFLIPWATLHFSSADIDLLFIDKFRNAKRLYWLDLTECRLSTLCFLPFLTNIEILNLSGCRNLKIMLSRGKVLVKLALKKSSVNLTAADETTSESRRFKIQGKEIEEQLPTNSEQIPSSAAIESASDKVLAEKDSFEASLGKDDETLSATTIDINNNRFFGDNDECSDASAGYEDDVQDPDWRAQDSQSSDTDDQNMDDIEIDHEEVIDTVASESNCSKRKQQVKDHFMKEIQKRKRMRGEQYLGVMKNKDSGMKSYCIERAGRLLCLRNCGRKCHRTSNTRQCPRVEDDDRIQIFEKFWKNMDWKEKRLK
ncbi:hypothetical protein ACF0H5_005602 [Mactra antiquata]